MDRPRTYWVGESDGELIACRDEVKAKIEAGLIVSDLGVPAAIDDELERRAFWRAQESQAKSQGPGSP